MSSHLYVFEIVQFLSFYLEEYDFTQDSVFCFPIYSLIRGLPLLIDIVPMYSSLLYCCVVLAIAVQWLAHRWRGLFSYDDFPLMPHRYAATMQCIVKKRCTRKCMWQVRKQSSHDKSSPDKVVPTKISSNIKQDFKYESIHPQFCLSTTTAASETFFIQNKLHILL